MCKWGTETELLVTIPAHLSHTSQVRQAVKGIDSCIAEIVRALNEGGITTISSCCGHGKRDGEIQLADGRVLVIKTQASDNYPLPHSETEVDAEFIAHARTDIPALIRDWRALQAVLNDPQKWMQWCDHQVLEENEVLREQLAEAQSEIRGVLDALGDNAVHSHPDGGPEDIYESLAISVARLQSQLAQVTSERDGLKERMFRVNKGL